MKKIVIEVTCTLDSWDDLDPDDRHETGAPIPDGMYLLEVKDAPEGCIIGDLRDLIDDHFHQTIPIACLEDFMILHREANSSDLEIAESMTNLGSIAYREMNDEDPSP